MKYLIALITLFLTATAAMAQLVPPADPTVGFNLAAWLSTTGGIVAATIGLVEILKRWALPRVPVLGDIPTFVWAIIVSAVLTGLAVALGLLHGPAVEAPTWRDWTVFVVNVIGAAAAAGWARDLLNTATSTPRNTAPPQEIVHEPPPTP